MSATAAEAFETANFNGERDRSPIVVSAAAPLSDGDASKDCWHLVRVYFAGGGRGEDVAPVSCAVPFADPMPFVCPLFEKFA